MNQAPAVILLAEDEPLASMALRAQIEALGHDVVGVARDGHEAVVLGRCVPADLAIFDMNMPGRSGLDAAADLFADAPTPVLLLTGFGAADLPDPLPRPPIFAILTKPVGLAELQDGIAAARAAFTQWTRREDRDAEVRQAREERRMIASALESDAAISAGAARTFLQRARDEGTEPAALARRILQREG